MSSGKENNELHGKEDKILFRGWANIDVTSTINNVAVRQQLWLLDEKICLEINFISFVKITLMKPG